MHSIRLLSLPALALAMAACSSIPVNNASLDQARSDFRDAQASPRTQSLAAAELKQAADALARAEASFAQRDDAVKVDQLAYLSRQRTALAQEAASRKGSEAAVAAAGAERDKLRLAARTQAVESATQNAATANRDAAASQRDAAASQQQAREADQRSQALEGQLRELNATQTARGAVVTVGDTLFDTGRAELKSGGVRNLERLGGFLKQYPQRKALIEGYTDSTGNSESNLMLSERRADAVMTALVGMGVGQGQLTAQGFGAGHPVAGNDNAGGRQMNRRVEIVLSDEKGVLGSR